MRKIIITVGVAGLMLAPLGAGPAGAAPLSQAPLAPVPPSSGSDHAPPGSGGGSRQPGPSKKALAAADTWAKQQWVKDARTCRSGGNYRLKSDDYYGGYGLSTKVWRKYGSTTFADRPDKARRAEQNYTARQYFRAAKSKSVLSCPTDSWMQRVYSGKRSDTALSQMLIPGTHDAGASRINVTPPCANRSVMGKEAYYNAGLKNPCGLAGMLKSQNLTIGQQLARGVRYLDLRVGVLASKKVTAVPTTKPAPEDVGFVLEHQLASESLADVFADIQRFVKKHPKEQIIMDFQAVELLDDKNPGNKVVNDYYKSQLSALLRTYRADSSLKPICGTAWSSDVIATPDALLGTDVPIKQAWAKGRNLLVFLLDGTLPDDPCFRDRWAGSGFLWPNTDDPSKSTEYNHDKLVERKQRIAAGSCTDNDGNNWCGLFVNQLQLTVPATNYKCLDPANGTACMKLTDLAAMVNNQIAGNVKKWRFSEKLPVNIAMVDFIEASDPSIPNSLIAMNWKVP